MIGGFLSGACVELFFCLYKVLYVHVDHVPIALVRVGLFMQVLLACCTSLYIWHGNVHLSRFSIFHLHVQDAPLYEPQTRAPCEVRG